MSNCKHCHGWGMVANYVPGFRNDGTKFHHWKYQACKWCRGKGE